MGRGKFVYSAESARDALHIPDDLEITGVQYDFVNHVVTVYVVGPSAPDSLELQEPSVGSLTVTLEGTHVSWH